MQNIRVLIVEDDPMVAEINKKFTEAVEGFTVDGLVKNAGEAKAHLKRRPIDLLILDIYLPEQSGMDFLKELRREDVQVDVIMVTAADETKMVSQVLRQGIIAYITKPFKFDRYRTVLEAYRNFYKKTLKKTNLEQSDIDGILSMQTAPGDVETPKNFNQHTLHTIIDYLMEQSQFQSAEEIAAGVGISRVTARRYLEFLVEQGKIQRSMDYLAVGRPVHKFRII